MQQLEAPIASRQITGSFDRLCRLAAGPVSLAVSGGGDSMALLVLAADWARLGGRPLIAFTVDHGLRPEAADEARFVAEAAARLGVMHRTLRWEAPRPGQAKARAARHGLLARAAGEAGSRLILTAHTEDDQAETFLIRARAGSGWYGLAGIQPVSLSPAEDLDPVCILVRPLLNVSRSDLRRISVGSGQDWIEDPSNENPAYERVRVRRRLAADPALRAGVLACQRKLQLLRQLQDRALGEWLRDHVTATPDGAILTGAPLPPGDFGTRALATLIRLATARTRPVRSDALMRLALRLQAPESFRPATLGGAILSCTKGGVKAVAEQALPTGMVNAMPERLAALRTACSGGM